MTEDRVLPHSLDAERSVLGAVLVHNPALDVVVDLLTAADFFREAHRTIYAALVALHARGAALDFLTLKDALQQQGRLESVGGASYIAGLTEGLPRASNVAYYAGIVARTSAKRQVITVAQDLTRQAYDDDAEAAVLIDAAERALLEVSRRAVPGDLQSAADLSTATLPVLEALLESRRAVTGVSTGLPTLDGLTRGLHPGNLVIVAGRPGSGKSSIALQMALDVAQTGPVAFFSVEMSGQEQVFRVLSILGRVDGHRLQSGQLGSREQESVGRALSDFGGRAFWLDDTGTISAMQIRSRCRRLKARQGLRMVVVDYLQLLSHAKAETREQAVASTTRAFKQIARELEVPVVVLSQLSRKVEDRQGKRPTLADLRESGSIEQDADLVLLIYRPEPTSNGMVTETPATELIIAKQRNGPLASVELVWLGEQFRFVELERRVA